MNDENPLTEPKAQRSRAKKVLDGLLLMIFGVVGFVLFLIIDSAVNIRIIPLAALGIVGALLGIGMMVLTLTGGADDVP